MAGVSERGVDHIETMDGPGILNTVDESKNSTRSPGARLAFRMQKRLGRKIRGQYCDPRRIMRPPNPSRKAFVGDGQLSKRQRAQSVAINRCNQSAAEPMPKEMNLQERFSASADISERLRKSADLSHFRSHSANFPPARSRVYPLKRGGGGNRTRE